MQLVDRPNTSDHLDYRVLIGAPKPLRSIKELLNEIINKNEWSWEIERALQELADYFKLPKDWWKDREGMGVWLLNAIAAAFADAWIYREWLRENQPQFGDAYMDFFARSVMHSEWVEAVEAQWSHYPLKGGNLSDVLPHIGDFMLSKQLKRTPWYPSYKQKIGQELNRRSYESYTWLRNLFVSRREDKAKKLEEGMNHISFAAIKGDKEFFIGLGKALSETFIPCDILTLEQIQAQPINRSRGVVTARQWCRRIWLSRGLWLMPSHLLRQEPFDLPLTTISELTGQRYKDGKRLTQNDSLYRAEDLWFNEWQAEWVSISMTTKGKEMLPNHAEKGFPWSIVSADFK